MSLLQRDTAALVVIDVQEGFRPYAAFEGVASSAAKLLAASRILGVPALVLCLVLARATRRAQAV